MFSFSASVAVSNPEMMHTRHTCVVLLHMCTCMVAPFLWRSNTLQGLVPEEFALTASNTIRNVLRKVHVL